jgi:hypothetical protein
MKKNYFSLFGLFIGLWVGYVETAQAQFTITGEVRPRAEFRNGFKKLTTAETDAAFFVEQRSRVYFDYQAEKLKLRLTLQDIRIWGGVNQIYKTENAMSNVYEAWGEYAFNPRFSLRVGRQALDYDNARFLGNLDWAQQGRSHDAALLMYKDSTGFEIHAAGAFNQQGVNEPVKLANTLSITNEATNYKTMQFLWLHKEFTDKAKFSFLVANTGFQSLLDSIVYNRQTYGFIGSTKVGKKLRLEGELYYQGGKNSSGKFVDAILGSLSATLSTKLTPLTLGGDYLSGTKTTDTKDRFFNPLYGTNHKFYGYMDYFYVGSGHQSKGLVDIFFKTNFKLGKKVNLTADYHHFNSPVAIKSTTDEVMPSNLGDEIDLVLTAKVSKEMSFNLGYSQMFATKSMAVIKGGDNKAFTNWAWAMLTIKPTFFKSAK